MEISTFAASQNAPLGHGERARKLTRPEHVLITGTTSGIGRGLLAYYASKGLLVTSVNRRIDKELEAAFPKARFLCVDVRDTEAIKDVIAKFVQEGAVPDLFILNAGITSVDNDTTLNIGTFREIVDINLLGIMNFVSPLTAMRKWPKTVKVVAVSSSTNYAANPYCLGYYISKKAVTQSFEVLAAMYRKTNLRFKWVVLGPVPTSINAKADKLPKLVVCAKAIFSVSVAQTVEKIAKFVNSNRCCLRYPLRSIVLFHVIRMLKVLLPGFYRGQKTLSGQPRGMQGP